MGTCGQPGYVFRNSVFNRVGKSAIFVLNRVRVIGALPHLPTKGYIEYPLPGVLLVSTHSLHVKDKALDCPTPNNILFTSTIL